MNSFSPSRISSVYRGCHATSSSVYGLKSRLIRPIPCINPVKEHNCPGCLGVTAGVVVVKGAGAVMLLFRLEYKTSVVCHNVNTQNVKIARGCQ